MPSILPKTETLQKSAELCTAQGSPNISYIFSGEDPKERLGYLSTHTILWPFADETPLENSTQAEEDGPSVKCWSYKDKELS